MSKKQNKVHDFKGVGSGTFPKLTPYLNTMLVAMNFSSVDKLQRASDLDIRAVPGVGPKKLAFIRRMYGRIEELRLPTKTHVVMMEQSPVDEGGVQQWSYDIYVAPIRSEHRLKMVQTRKDAALERDLALISAGIDIGNAGIYPLATRRAEEVAAATSQVLLQHLSEGRVLQ